MSSEENVILCYLYETMQDYLIVCILHFRYTFWYEISGPRQ